MKQSDDQKLDEMLYNIYNSKAKRVFYFSAEKNTENDKVFKSHAEHSRRKYFSHSGICAIAAAFLVTVGIGTIFFDDLSSSITPASVSEVSETSLLTGESDYSYGAVYDDTDTEKSIFEQYLEEFKYETENFNYQALRIVPYTSDTSDSDNELYEMLSNMNIIPQCDSLWIYTYENGNNIIYSDSESELYLCIKLTDSDIITRQSYLVWTDENGDISKIIPSSEKFSDEDMNNSENIKINVNASNIIDEKVNRVSEIINNIEDYSNEDIKNSIDYSFLLSLTASGNQGAENAEYPDIYNIENFFVYEYYFYYINDGKIIPVMCVSSEYSAYTDKYHESLFFDCSGDTPFDITEQILDENKNYWLEKAVSSYDNDSNSEIDEESIDSYTFSSLSFMKGDDLKKFKELCGENALESTYMGYNLYSCYLENYVQIADGIDFNMSPSEIYNAIDTDEKYAVGLNNQETVFFTGENNPDEELEEIYDICFRDSKEGYSIEIHFPAIDTESDDERLNSPWVEIRFN